MTSTTEPCTTSLGVGQESDACVRFVHTSPDAGQVDVYIDDQPVAQAFSYGTPTEFAAVANGEHQVRVVAAGQSVDNALLDETMTFDTGMASQDVVFESLQTTTTMTTTKASSRNRSILHRYPKDRFDCGESTPPPMWVAST